MLGEETTQELPKNSRQRLGAAEHVNPTRLTFVSSNVLGYSSVTQ